MFTLDIPAARRYILLRARSRHHGSREQAHCRRTWSISCRAWNTARGDPSAAAELNWHLASPSTQSRLNPVAASSTTMWSSVDGRTEAVAGTSKSSSCSDRRIAGNSSSPSRLDRGHLPSIGVPNRTPPRRRVPSSHAGHSRRIRRAMLESNENPLDDTGARARLEAPSRLGCRDCDDEGRWGNRF